MLSDLELALRCLGCCGHEPRLARMIETLMHYTIISSTLASWYEDKSMLARLFFG